MLLWDINVALPAHGSVHHSSTTTAVQNPTRSQLCLDQPVFLKNGRARSCLLLHEKRVAVVHVLRLSRITNFTLAVPITFLHQKCAWAIVQAKRLLTCDFRGLSTLKRIFVCIMSALQNVLCEDLLPFKNEI